MTTSLNDISDSPAEYQSFFRESPCPMWILDPATFEFLDVNEAAIKQYGYNREEFLKLKLPAMRAASDSERVKSVIQSRDDRDFFDAGISRHKRKNGEVFYVHVYAQAIMFEGRRVRLAMLIDRNEEVLAEQKNKELNDVIKTQKDQLDTILSSVDVVIWSKRTDTFQTVYVNRASAKVYGYTPSELIADQNIFSQLVYPADKAIYLDAIKKIMETGSAEYEIRAYHKDGSLRYLKTVAVLVKGKNDEPDTISGFTEDITEERQLQQKITEDQHNLRSLIDNTEDYIWSVSKDMKYISINEAYKNFLKQVTGKTVDWGDVSTVYDFETDIRDTWLEYYKRAFNGETFITVDEAIIQGAKHYYEVRFTPIYDADKNLLGTSVFSRDITARRSHLLLLEAQNERLKDIAWMQSHKIRNHVATILGLAQLLNQDTASSENVELVHGIKTAAVELDTAIKQINLMTRDVRIS